MSKRCKNCFREIEDSDDVCLFCGYYEGQPPKELYHLFPQTVLAGRYVIGEVVGFGGFGITYKAWDSNLNMVVAIKEYYPSGLVTRLPGDPMVNLYAAKRAREFQYGLERFLDEAKNMAQFSSHQNIVNVNDYFMENNTAYIVMEFLDGVTLSGFLKENTLDLDTCLEIIGCISNALKEIHKHGIIHRDVSPDNIFLCLNGNVKLIDFGAARFVKNEESQLTIILKPGFAPPEQYEKISVQGPWTDIYALGATLYLMVTGVKPEESTDRKIEDHLAAPHELNPEIPENISNTIMKAMALEKHMRFSRIEEFEKALNGQKKIVSLAREKKHRKRKRVIGIAAAVLVLAVTGSTLAMRYFEEKERETLPQANILLQYELSGDEGTDSMKNDALTSIAAEFMDSFPEVVIEIQGDRYQSCEELQEAESNGGSRLAIFESTQLPPSELQDQCLGLSEILTEESLSRSGLLNQYADSFPENVQLPLGFVAPVIYRNRTISESDLTRISDFTELEEEIAGSGSIAVNQEFVQGFEQAFGTDLEKQEHVRLVEGPGEFISGSFAYYVGTSDDYRQIQSEMPGRYTVLAMDTGTVPVLLTDTYSIPTGLSDDEQKVAEAFLNFMLSENAQDCYYIQNWNGRLPLNQFVRDVVESVYSDFDGFFDNADDYVVADVE